MPFFATEWIYLTVKGPNQMPQKIRDEIEDNFRRKYGMNKMAESLRVKLQGLHRESQHYHASKKVEFFKRNGGRGDNKDGVVAIQNSRDEAIEDFSSRKHYLSSFI